MEDEERESNAMRYRVERGSGGRVGICVCAAYDTMSKFLKPNKEKNRKKQNHVDNEKKGKDEKRTGDLKKMLLYC